MRQLSILIAVLGSTSSAVAQSMPVIPADQCRIEGIYRLNYQRDSTDKTIRTELLRLQLGSQLSRFESKAQLFMDSVVTTASASAQRMQGTGEVPSINLNGLPIRQFKASLKGVIYKVPTAKQVLVYERIGTARYVYQEQPGLFTWVITPATATIAGYACQRATTTFGGRTWEAWFAREIPVADGPYKFYGLPGLIVKVGDGHGQYVFELLKLTKLAVPMPITLPEAGAKAVDKAVFTKGKADYDRTALTQMMASGSIRFNSPEEAESAKQQARDRVNKNNNPLELK
jgi:GLPGLI family protein